MNPEIVDNSVDPGRKQRAKSRDRQPAEPSAQPPMLLPERGQSERKSRDGQRRNQRAGGVCSRRSDKNCLRVINDAARREGWMDGQHEERVKEGRSDGVDDKSISHHICYAPAAGWSPIKASFPVNQRSERGWPALKTRVRGPPHDVITVKRTATHQQSLPPSKKINK